MGIVLLTDVTILQNETCLMTIADVVKTFEVTRLGEKKLLRNRISWRPVHA